MSPTSTVPFITIATAVAKWVVRQFQYRE
jgi:hypothetical protein